MAEQISGKIVQPNILDLIQKELNGPDFHSISLPQEYMKRHKVNPLRLIELLKKFLQYKFH